MWSGAGPDTRASAWKRSPSAPSWNTSLTSIPRAHQFVAGSRDVGDDQVLALGRTGRGGREVGAELDRAAGARRRELDQAEAAGGGDVGVDPPAEAAHVELLCALDIRDGEDDHLEVHVDGPGAGDRAGVVAAGLGVAHGGLREVG